MRLQLRADVTHTATEYGAVLLDLRQGEYFELNSTGALVLRVLLAGHSQAHAAGALTEQYDVDPPQARQAVDALITQLRDAALITVTHDRTQRRETGQ